MAPLVEVQPLQPSKVCPALGAAVSITVAPVVNCALQDDGLEQLMAPVTVPVPVPAKSTVRIGWGPAGVQPEAAGPFTVMGTELLTTSLG
ncbi:MAG: hypothetical protein WA412_08230, partial [Candidatus Sulfotelmatobacter sp.]